MRQLDTVYLLLGSRVMNARVQLLLASRIPSHRTVLPLWVFPISSNLIQIICHKHAHRITSQVILDSVKSTIVTVISHCMQCLKAKNEVETQLFIMKKNQHHSQQLLYLYLPLRQSLEQYGLTLNSLCSPDQPFKVLIAN